MKAAAKATITLPGALAVYLMLAVCSVGAPDPPVTPEQLQSLQRQNQQLQQQLQKQQELIDALSRKVSEIQDINAQHDRDLGDLKAQAKPSKTEAAEPPASGSPFHLGKVDISGEGGVAFFKSQSQGQTPNSGRVWTKPGCLSKRPSGRKFISTRS
jgi:hypothetical protein